MNTILKTDENISDIAIAYFDPKEEVLREISETDVYFAVSPFSSQYRRFYVIGDLLYSNNISIRAFVEPLYEFEYTVKLLFGTTYNSLRDFDEAHNSVVATYQQVSSKYLNAVPLDVLITSNSVVDKTVGITFEISTDLPDPE